MSFYHLALGVGILSGIMILGVIFSLLTMAQRADAYLEQMAATGEKGGGLENHQTVLAGVPLPGPEGVCKKPSTLSRASELT